MERNINRNITRKRNLPPDSASPPQLKYAAWAHGVSAQVERPNFLIGHRLGVCTLDDGDAWLGILRQGDGAKFYGEVNTSNWFHFALHAPVILDGIRLKLSKIFVLFACPYTSAVNNPETGYGTKVNSVHVWDGPTRIKTYDHLDLYGGYKTIKENVNQFILEPALPVYFGINISVGVSFVGTYSVNNKIKFYAAGGDFI